MAALAYVLLPLTGMIAFFSGRTSRVRFHGLQAIAYGIAWPTALYGASMISATATRVVFAAGVLAWLVLVAATAFGRDPGIPWVSGTLRRLAG